MRWEDLELGLSWLSIVLMFVATETALFVLDPFWILIGMWALCIAVLPVVINRRVESVLPFEFLLPITVPFIVFILGAFAGWLEMAFYSVFLRGAEVAATFLIALATVIDLHAYTDFDTNEAFAVFLTVAMTMALGSIFAIADFISDELLGTHLLVSNNELMINLVFSFLGGLLMGVLLIFYLRRMPISRLERYSLPAEGDR